MSWTIEFTARSRKDLRGIGVGDRRRIIAFLEERVASHPEPRTLAKKLVATDMELWRFRVGDYRIVSKFEDDRLVILVVTIGHRREVYK